MAAGIGHGHAHNRDCMVISDPSIVAHNITDAVRANQLDRVLYFLDTDPSCVNQRDDDNVTPLHWACLENYLDIVRILVQRGANLDAATIQEGHTPLAWACIRGHIKVLLFLIVNGANLEKLDNRGYHALHHAVMYDKLDLVYYFLTEFKLNINMQDSAGHTLLMWAAYIGSVPMTKLLLQFKADITARDQSGYTTLHWAAVKGHISVVELLIQSGADMSVSDFQGNTPLSEANRRKHVLVEKYITLAKTYPQVAQQGRNSYKGTWFMMSAVQILWFFFCFTYLPFFVLAVPAFIIPCSIFWKRYGEVRWISNSEGKNPFWLGFFMMSFLFSVVVFLLY
jgi:palmitoyltransferase